MTWSKFLSDNPKEMPVEKLIITLYIGYNYFKAVFIYRNATYSSKIFTGTNRYDSRGTRRGSNYRDP